MEIRELADEIIDLVYHGAVLSDDPSVQERIVHSDIYNLIEQFEKEIVDDRLSEIVEENRRLEKRVFELETA
jgi:hypothetical protein